MHEDVRFVSAAGLSPVEVIGAFLERAEERNQELDAYVTMLGDGNMTGPTSASGEVVDLPMGRCLPYPADFTGHPAAPVPAGFNRGGPPVGTRLIGRRFDKETVLAAGAAFERTRPWYGSQRNGKRRSHA